MDTVPISKSFGKDAILAGSENHFAGMDRFVVDHVVQARVGIAAALDDAVGARVGQQRAGAAIFVA